MGIAVILVLIVGGVLLWLHVNKKKPGQGTPEVGFDFYEKVEEKAKSVEADIHVKIDEVKKDVEPAVQFGKEVVKLVEKI